MMMSSSSVRYPFTATQWQELEHQALVFKYMVSGMPIPPDLLFSIRTSLDSSLSSNFLIHQPPHIGWSSFQMGLGRKIDPEPGRCRRTDGKKWRCSKEAFPDSKYCQRHMHRGRNRSRKPVEILSPTPTPTNFFLQPNANPHPRPPPKEYCSYGNGMKGESEEHELFSNLYSSSKLESLTMSSSSSSSSQSQTKNNAYASDHHRLYSGGEAADEQQPKKVMHHFLDEWAPPRETESWNKSEESMPSHRTQLSISIPNSLHDFFVTQKW